MIEREKLIEVYNCVGSTVLGYSMVSFLVFISVVNIVWVERYSVGLEPGGTHVEYLGNYDGVRGR